MLSPIYNHRISYEFKNEDFRSDMEIKHVINHTSQAFEYLTKYKPRTWITLQILSNDMKYMLFQEVVCLLQPIS